MSQLFLECSKEFSHADFRWFIKSQSVSEELSLNLLLRLGDHSSSQACETTHETLECNQLCLCLFLSVSRSILQLHISCYYIVDATWEMTLFVEGEEGVRQWEVFDITRIVSDISAIWDSQNWWFSAHSQFICTFFTHFCNEFLTTYDLRLSWSFE